MDNFSEVIKIIEAGLEGDRTKLIAYANLLTNKVNEKQSQMIIDRITGEYKKQNVLRILKTTPKKKNSEVKHEEKHNITKELGME